MVIHPSSLAELFDCPARWAAKNIDKIELPTSGAAHLGTSIHFATATFDQAKIDKKPIAIDDAVGSFVEKLNEDGIDWGKNTPKDVEPVGIDLVKLYCKEISPKFTFIGVEAKSETLSINGLDLEIFGTIDRIYTDNQGNLGIADLKTGQRIVTKDGIKTIGYEAQLGMYEILAQFFLQKPITLPASIIGFNTTKNPKIDVASIKSPKEIVVGNEYQKGMLEIASQIIKSGNFYGNCKSVLCTPKYCPIFKNCFWHR